MSWCGAILGGQESRSTILRFHACAMPPCGWTAPPKMLSLALLPADNVAPPSPAALTRGEKQQLETIRYTQVARVRERRALARQRQIASLQQAWKREARAAYVQRARQAQGNYLRRIRQTLADRDVQRLNLSLQIKALQDIVTSWKVSTPPTPRLTQARAELAQKRALLAQLEASGIKPSRQPCWSGGRP